MSLTPRRARRWLQRTLWMLRAVAADFGFSTEDRGRRGGDPMWLRDNPFLLRTTRGESRRFVFFWRFLLMLMLTGGAMIGMLALIDAYPGGMAMFATRTFGVPAPALLGVALITIHVSMITRTRAALTPSLAAEARRQTLDGLLATPARPAEMIAAMAVGPMRGALLMALAGLPLYLLTQQLGGMEASDIVWMALFFALLSFTPPSYVLPALGGAAATPAQQAALRKARARQQRGDSGSSPGIGIFGGLIFLFVFAQLFAIARGGGWMLHLIAPLQAALPHSGFASIALMFAWPYTAIHLMGAALPFYHTHLTPLVYLLPLLALGRVAGMLRSGAALTAAEATDIPRTPLARRSAAIARWSRRLAMVCVCGYAWKGSIESGDTAGLLGHGPGGGWSEAGLLLLFSIPVIAATAWRTVTMRVALRDHTLRRTPSQLIKGALRKSLPPFRATLLLFAAVCILGGASPVSAPVLRTLGQIALTGGATVCYYLGVNVLLTVLLPRRGLRIAVRWTLALLFPLPIVALYLPFAWVWHLAAASPLCAWIQLFPTVSASMRGATGDVGVYAWPFGAEIPSWECFAGPAVMGILCMRWAYALTRGERKAAEASRARLETSRDAPSDPAAAHGRALAGQRAVKPARPRRIANQDKTEALMDWVRLRIDNPLVIRELRTSTRSGAWYQWLFIVPALFLALQAVTWLYPDVVMGFSGGLAWLQFFPPGGGMAASVTPDTYAAVAGIVFMLQIYALSLRLPPICEAILRRDQQAGVFGFILLTPMRTAQIFWGLVFGSASVFGVAWAAFGVILLFLYLQAAPSVGIGPAMTAWTVGQLLVAALLALGAGFGSAMATHATALRAGKGVSMLLMLSAIFVACWLIFHTFGDLMQTFSPVWTRNVYCMLAGILITLPFTILAFLYGEWRLRVLRRRDIAFGDALPR